MDEDLFQMTRDDLIEEVRRLRQGIRQHRDSSLHELCWHHPSLWGLLPEKSDPIPVVPSGRDSCGAASDIASPLTNRHRMRRARPNPTTRMMLNRWAEEDAKKRLSPNSFDGAELSCARSQLGLHEEVDNAIRRRSFRCRSALCVGFLRLALGATFLTAVADRFGLWGPAGTANVAGGTSSASPRTPLN